jgi:hypothetical protein
MAYDEMDLCEPFIFLYTNYNINEMNIGQSLEYDVIRT